MLKDNNMMTLDIILRWKEVGFSRILLFPVARSLTADGEKSFKKEVGLCQVL
jgi:hypothetical protein